MRYIFALLIFFFSHLPGWAQNDKVIQELFRNLSCGCDFQKKDSLQEVAFSINLFMDIELGNLDSLTVTGNLPPNCYLSQPKAVARENRFLKNYLSKRKINWRAWLSSFGYDGCQKVKLVFPHILGTYNIKGDLGSTYYKDFVVPFYEFQELPNRCTLVFKPIVSRSMFTVF